MSERNAPPKDQGNWQAVRAGRERTAHPPLAGPRILGVECATRALGLAVFEGGQLRAEVARDVHGHHAEHLLPELDRLLALLEWAPDDLDGIAVSIGPGSFTGLRVGLATVKGIAFGGDPPVVPVSTLAGIAAGAAPLPGPVAALLDARRGEVYAGVWSCPGAPEADLVAESVYRPEELAECLPDGTRMAVGEGAEPVAKALVELRPDVSPLGAPVGNARAETIARIGSALLADGAGLPADQLVPRYLRRAEAEVQRTGQALEE